MTKITYKKITKKQCVDTSMAMVLVCLLVANVFFQIEKVNMMAIMILVVGMSVPKILKPFAFLWLNFAYYLGSIVSKILLSIIFYFLVTPIGFLVQLIQKDPLQLKGFKKTKDSVFKMRHHLFVKNDLKNPF